MGHDPQTHLKHYAHVVSGITGKRYADLDELIAEARIALECHRCKRRTLMGSSSTA